MVDSSKDQVVPRIEFPCDYPIKVMGVASSDFQDFVISVVKKHAPDFDGHVEVKNSRAGNYLSIHVVIVATGLDQLKALDEELKASGRIKMIL